MNTNQASKGSSNHQLPAAVSSRWLLLTLFLLVLPCSAWPATLCVTNLNDNQPGSLRTVIAEANAGDTVQFCVNGVATLTAGPIHIAKDLALVGPGAMQLTLSGNFASRHFVLGSSSVAVTISGLTLAQGRTDPFDSDGGSIHNFSQLRLVNCVLRDNAGYFGGAVVNWGELVMEGCTLSSNAAAHGGAFLSAGSVTLRNTTISGNRAHFGGGFYSYAPGTVVVLNSTIVSNTASGRGGGIHTEGTTILRSTILAGNSAPIAPDCDSITSQDFNLIQDTSGASILGPIANSLLGVDPLLGPLADNGGPTPSHALGAQSRAVDGGISGGLAVDQRGVMRPTDLPGIPNSGDGTDIGAYELSATDPQSGTTLMVNTTTDADDGHCTFGHCSLREALAVATAGEGPWRILITVQGSLSLTSALPALSGSIHLAAPAPASLTIQRGHGGAGRIFEVPAGSTAVLSGLTLSNGNAIGLVNESGGCILNEGTLTVTNCVVSGNRAQAGGGISSRGSLQILASIIVGNIAETSNGGGVASIGPLIIDACRFVGNRAAHFGGGLYNIRNGQMTTTLFSGNQAVLASGGGIWNENDQLELTRCALVQNQAGSGGGLANKNGTVTMRACTISSNSASFGGGILQGAFGEPGGPLSLHHSTVAGNIATNAGGGLHNTAMRVLSLRSSIVAGNTNSAGMGDDIRGNATSLDYNLIQTTTGVMLTGELNHTILGQDPLLGPLADNGGLMPSHALLPGSAALDAGIADGTVIDGRGLVRPIDLLGVNNAADGCDIGAFEFGLQTGPFVVNVIDDEDRGACTTEHCSLREALRAPWSGPGPKQISFAGGVTGVIQLTGPLPTLTNDVVVTGPGPGALTVRRNSGGDYRLFTVGPGATVQLRGLGMADGLPAGFGDGGGILNEGTLALADCVISGCRAYDGGAILNSGDLSLTNCLITANGVTHDGYGGGLYNNCGRVVLFNTELSNNSSGNDISDGGGIYNPCGEVRLHFCRVLGNSASAGVGGGIYNGATGLLWVHDSTLMNNMAIAGGGLLNEGGTVVVTRSDIAGNTAYDDDGGGLWNSGQMRVTNALVRGNWSDFSGGGIYNGGSFQFSAGTVMDNVAYDGAGVFSGGIVDVVNSTISGNVTSDGFGGGSGGGFYNTGHLTLRSSTIYNNRSPFGAGGGIYVSAGSVTARSCILAGSQAAAGANGLDCHGPLTSLGFNLVQSLRGCVLNGSAGCDVLGLDPLLGPLTALSPLTRVHIPSFNSPVIDQGDSGGVAQDQRAQMRPVSGPCPRRCQGDGSDIGAVEIQEPNSTVCITALVRSGSDFAIHFATLEGRTYWVERATNVVAGPWDVLCGPLLGTGAQMQCTDAGAANRPLAFYRIRMAP